MNDKQFIELKAAVKMMVRYVRGEKVAGLRVYEMLEPDVRTIREADRCELVPDVQELRFNPST
jgi:hypothetical protein